MYKNILISVDLSSEEAEIRAIETAVEYARAFGSNLHIMTVVPDYGMSIVGSFFPKDHEQQAIQHARESLHAFTSKYVPDDISCRHIVAHGSIYRQILRYAKVVEADIIILSAKRPGPEDYLIGPNAARVVRHATIPVLIVR
ncbi:universal stress protein [Chelativorans sp. Marseille-P2723]|uniref:universal stress protein n=1 Tax=Chelativorans sp. Marseille-P2723 TaxID=2709133 RepID=UPI00156D452B|nr:universal stress protein [Chelativorans sp. Marseille-P2723]